MSQQTKYLREVLLTGRASPADDGSERVGRVVPTELRVSYVTRRCRGVETIQVCLVVALSVDV